MTGIPLRRLSGLTAAVSFLLVGIPDVWRRAGGLATNSICFCGLHEKIIASVLPELQRYKRYKDTIGRVVQGMEAP